MQFSYFDKDNNKIVDGKIFESYKFCKDKIKQGDTKCIKHYNDKFKEGCFQECPYGLNSYYKNDIIFTSIILKENLNKKAKRNNIKIFDINKLDNKTTAKLIDNNCESIIKYKGYEDLIHDIGNVSGFFSNMIDEYYYHKQKEDFNKINDSLESILSLYELITFRLDFFYNEFKYTHDSFNENIHPILMKFKYLFKSQCEKKNININVSKSSAKTDIPKELMLSFFILYENAIKYCVHDEQIDVTILETNKKLIISFTNKSNNIIEKDINKLFIRGYRGSNAKSTGRGLGLSFCKEILESVNCTLEIEIKKIDNNYSKFCIKIVKEL